MHHDTLVRRIARLEWTEDGGEEADRRHQNEAAWHFARTVSEDLILQGMRGSPAYENADASVRLLDSVK